VEPVNGQLSVSRPGSLLKYWLPVVLWMGLIFSASSDAASSEHSSRILGPLLHWLFPGMLPETVDATVLGIRKAAHMTEYALLSLLVWRALRKPARPDPRPWNWKQAGVALAWAIGYAASDEIHQSFVPSRQGQFTDVLFDSTGALLGLLGLWLFGRWRKRW
jgi:VanZ family protein